MIVLPAIDLLGGKCVRMTGGKLGTEWVVSDDPVATARDWEQRGAEGLHVVDLDRTLGRGQNTDLVARIVKAVKVPVQVGGGLRDAKDLDAARATGAARLVVGTKGVKDPAWLRAQAERLPERLMLAVDAAGLNVLVKGWTEQTEVDALSLVVQAGSLPLAGFLYTNVEVEGQARGLDWGPVTLLIVTSRLPMLISGGISSVEDVRKLRELGAWGVVLGTALYRGMIDFHAALKAAEGE